MPMRIQCPGCKSGLTMPDKAVGRTVQCPKCKKSLKIEAPKPALPTAPKTPEVLDESDLELVEDEVLDESGLDVIEEEGPEFEPDDESILNMMVAEGDDPFEGIDIDEESREGILSELTKGERILWVGYPSARIAEADFQSTKWIVFPFCGLFTVIGIVMMVLGIGNIGLLIGGFIFTAFPILCVFLFLKFGKPSSDRISTFYLLTNRRAFSWTNLGYDSDQIDNFHVGDLSRMKRRDHRKIKGAGKLVFKTRVEEGVGSNEGTSLVEVGFDQLENVRKVEQLIRRLLVDKMIDRMVR